MDLVERVAKVFAGNLTVSSDEDYPAGVYEIEGTTDLNELARLAITEVFDWMREPSLEASDAGNEGIDDRCTSECSPYAVYRAILAELRKEAGIN